MLTKRMIILLPVLLARLGSAVAIPDAAIDSVATPDDLAPELFDGQSTTLGDNDDDAEDDDFTGFGGETDLSLVERFATPSEDVDLPLHENLGLGTLVGAIATRLIWYTAGKASKAIISVVLHKLLKTKTPEKHQTTIDYVEKALESITVIVLTKAIGKVPKVGSKLNMNVGADAGGKAKRGLLEGHDTAGYVSWDMSDDESHDEGNHLYGRSIVSDDLRSQMMDQGISNVTLVHVPTDNDAVVPFLAYTRDDTMNIHWRAEDSETDSKGDEVFKKHYPFFNAGGAGFKLSAMIPIDPKTAAFSPKDAAAAAKMLVKDFLTKRQSLSAVGYQEQNKATKWVGHQLCYIAEDNHFELDNQIDMCFAPSK